MVSADGKVALCGRVPSEQQVGSKGAGWLHVLDKAIEPPKYRRKVRENPTVNFFALQNLYRSNLSCRHIHRLAKELGVHIDALNRLGVGIFNKSYTFPMRNYMDRIVGIKRRMPNGDKFCIRGSHLGLYWPRGIDRDSKEVLYIPEGESDTAALLSLDFEAIGRPSCSAGTDDIAGLLRDRDRHVVIMLDKDKWKFRPDGSKFKPGQEGAYRLAKVIKPLVKSLKVVRPSRFNDIRQWLNKGATHAAVQDAVDNTRFE